jgi:hypothetical protein
VERALSAELLEQALGGRAGLPTPPELARTLAETELLLLTGRRAISETLVATGWYLHAIATSRWATQRYGVAQRVAAFRIAGHILDLALQCEDLTPYERRRYLFAAQVAYVRSRYEANAIALFTREAGTGSNLDGLTLEHDADRLALECAVAALGTDLSRVYRIARPIRTRSDALADQWGVESITNTVFGAAALVANGALELATFLERGDGRRLQAARNQFLRAVGSNAAVADRTSRWIAAHLAEISDLLGESSLWTALPPDVPSDVRRAFTRGRPRVLTLWPPQASFFPTTGDDRRHPLDPSVKRVFLSTPTSGGKTLLGQLLVAEHVSRGGSSVCYVAPTRSLCHEVRTHLNHRLRVLRTSVVDDLPPWVPVRYAPQSSVEVMTPERLSYLVRSDTDALLERFGLFLFDEVHNIGEVGRGWTLESTLSYLHHATAGTEHRLVLISAVAGNRAHFVQWLGGASDRRVLQCHSDWRAPRRLHSIWTTTPDWEAKVPVVQANTAAHARSSVPLRGELHVRVSGGGQVEQLVFEKPVGELVLRTLPSGKLERDSKASTPAYRCLVPLIRHLAKMGPTLVIESTRPATTRLARAIAISPGEPLAAAPQGLIDLVDARLGAEHPLAETLRLGVAFHHGSLPAEVRAGIEDAVSAGDVTCLVATTTMTEGINLPVRSVVVAAQGSWSAEGFHEYITGPKLVNAIGRAGRAARETEGIVVLARQAQYSAKDFDRLDPVVANMTVHSTLATDAALGQLAEFEQLLADGKDAVFEATGHVVPDFLAFVWFVASREEEISGQATLEKLQATLAATFAWVQLDTEQRQRWSHAAELGLQRFEQTPPDARRRWAQAGTSLASAQVIDGVVQDVLVELQQIAVPEDPNSVIDLLLRSGRLEMLLAMREAPTVRIFSRRSAPRIELPIPLEAILGDWLSGKELRTLSDRYFGGIENTDFRFEQLADYLNEYFETFLPWVLGSLVGWINDGLADRGVVALLPGDLAAYVRWGVNDAVALQLMTDGVRSRTLAHSVSRAWHGAVEPNDVRTWLGSIGVAAWRSLFNASIADLRSLLDYAKPRGTSLLASLFDGQSVTISVRVESDLTSDTEVELQRSGASDLAEVEILVSGNRVGVVSSRDQADVHSVLVAGLPFAARLAPRDDGHALILTPLEEPAQAELV